MSLDLLDLITKLVGRFAGHLGLLLQVLHLSANLGQRRGWVGLAGTGNQNQCDADDNRHERCGDNASRSRTVQHNGIPFFLDAYWVS